MRRLATAAFLLPLFGYVFGFAPAWFFYGLTSLWIALATWECYGLLEAAGGRPFKGLGLLGTLGVVWAFVGHAPHFEPQVPLVILTLVACASALAWRNDARLMLRTAAETLFPVMFVGLTLAHPVALRSLSDELGRRLLLLLLMCVVAADTGAYCLGRWLGRHPLAPLLSPRKTWEGAVGGLAASVLVAAGAHLWPLTRIGLGHALALGLLLGLAGLAGDLAESMVKRAAGVKDASALLPGHGGLLDRTDSMLFAGPVLYYYSRLLLLGPAGTSG